MTTPAEPKRIEANLAVIRAYLKRKFPHHVLTEVDAPGLYDKYGTRHTLQAKGGLVYTGRPRANS